jgi:parallel beta-helix repeat protein
MHKLSLAIFLTFTSLSLPAAPAFAKDPANIAYVDAGTDIEKLKAVAKLFPNTVWGQLAAARAKVLEAQQPVVSTNRQIKVEKKVVAPPPVPKVQPEEQAVVTPEPAVTVPAPATGTLRVAADGSGNYTSIADAIAAATSGGRIEVMPGTYSGGAVIDKPVEIVGMGSFEQVIWLSTGSDVVHWKASEGLISNITLHQKGGCEKTCNAIYFDNGSALVENTALTSEGGASVDIEGARSNPTITKSNIFDAKEGGIYLAKDTNGTISFNDIYNNSFAGIEIKDGSAPLIKGNNIRNGKQSGIFVNTNGRGTIEDNKIYENTFAGIEIKDRADPVVRNNQIYAQLESGVYVNAKGRGSIVNNDIYGNTNSNIEVTELANPSIRSNRIYDGKAGGIFVDKDGRGVFEDNEITNNTLSGVEISANSDPVIRNNTIKGGKQAGIFILDKGRGVIEDNQITGSGFSGIEVKKRGNPVVKNNRINGNQEYGIYIHDNGRGTYTDNDLAENKSGPWLIEKNAGKVKRSGNRE